jgi:hypothetical protein
MAPRLSNKLALVLQWAEAARELADVKVREIGLRLQVVAACFADDLERGTQRQDLGQGYGLKAEVPDNVKIDGVKVLEGLKQLRAEGDAGELLADRLVKFKPELRIGEWFKLSDERRAYFADSITITTGTPALELTKPPPAAG